MLLRSTPVRMRTMSTAFGSEFAHLLGEAGDGGVDLHEDLEVGVGAGRSSALSLVEGEAVLVASRCSMSCLMDVSGDVLDLRLRAGLDVDDVDALLLARLTEVDLEERAAVLGVGEREVLRHVDVTEGDVLRRRREALAA